MTSPEIRSIARHATGRAHGSGPIQGPTFERLRLAWAEARALRNTRHGPLAAAVTALAQQARKQGVPVGDVLRALNAVIDPRLGGDPALDWDHVREHAGGTAIASYYRDD